MAHLVIVFFRSHVNGAIFHQYPKRFLLAPLGLFTVMMLSSWILIFVFVLAVWWDVYHSSLQTFGLGRIYDKRAGNGVEAGRAIDKGLNLVFYVGPIFAGASLLGHVKYFERFADVGTYFFAKVPARTLSFQPFFLAAFILAAAAYLGYYVYFYFRLVKTGYRYPLQKLFLFLSTGICSIWAWGFNPFGQAFFIMNFFHAVQYFAIVWWSEKANMRAFFKLSSLEKWKFPVLFLFLVLGTVYGAWAKFLGESNHFAFSVLLTVSIMHFWYDGFIWSVRKNQVA